MALPAGLLPITNPPDYNFYTKITVNNAAWNARSDVTFAFSTYYLQLINEDSTNVVEYSFTAASGTAVHGELNVAKGTGTLTFTNRIVSGIFFRYKSGSSPGAIVRVEAYANSNG